jgi:23S rRNA (uracil1939-C5)-methyltransferase
LKQQGIDQLIRHQTGLDKLPWQPMLTSGATGYRRRARIGIWYDKKQQSFSVGFRRHGDKQIVSITHCMVLSAELNPVFAVLQQVLPRLTQPAAITHAEVLQADGRVFVIVRHVKALMQAERQLFIDAWPEAVWLGEAEPGQFEYWQSPVIPEYLLAEQQLRLQFAPDDFIQVNAGLNQQMVTQALNWLTVSADDQILDLYAGIGNFTLERQDFPRLADNPDSRREHTHRKHPGLHCLLEHHFREGCLSCST